MQVEAVEYRRSAASAVVDVPVAWRTSGGDPATSVQYRVDGVPMQIRTLDPAASDHGNTELSFTQPGDYLLSVALCDTDGCTASAATHLSVLDEAGTYLLDGEDAYEAQIAAIAEDLHARVAYWEGVYGPSESWGGDPDQRAAALGTTLVAKAVGKALFNGALGKASGEGMGRFMQLLGYDADPQQSEMQNAISDIADAVDALHGKVEAMASQLDDIANQIDDATGKAMWNAFRNSDNNLRIEVLPPIIDLFELTGFWSDSNPPSQTQVERYVADVRQAILAVRSAVIGSQGTLTMLLEALDYPAKVSVLTDYWPFVNDYRNEWQAVLAQGLLGLEYMRQFDTAGGYVAHQLASSRKVADQTVEAMWAAGLPFAQAKQPRPHSWKYDYVHLKGSGWVMAHGWRPELPDERWYAVETESELKPRLQAFVAQYRPDLHGGQSLQNWLHANGLQTWFPVMETFQLHADGQSSWKYWRVVGNELQAVTGTSKYGERPVVAKFRDVASNAGGRAARFDADAVQGHAFGFDYEIGWRDAETMQIVVANPFNASWLRVLDAETGERLDDLEAGAQGRFTLSAESVITLQWGEHGDPGPENPHPHLAGEVFEVIGEMHFVLPQVGGKDGTLAVHIDA